MGRAFPSRFGTISLETASQLLDFRGSGTSPISDHAAHEQLKGAVAIHNILQQEKVAYLADEVGMGKTYVALGALALFRHFNPNFRVLVIAPRENIQKKWIKELTNFCQRNVRFSDLRVRSAHGAPARAIISCGSLGELVRETAVDPDRDFFTRLTSFSLPLGRDVEGWKVKRNELLEHLPWVDPGLVDLRNKDRFKDNYARALNCALPVFDLVIFDEGHNIKGGLKTGGASRNRVLALAFGHPSEQELDTRSLPGYGSRARRVLFLSATPLENDYAQLWNQLDIFGHGVGRSILRSDKVTDEEKLATAAKFLIRRVATIPVGGKELTKNLYRREWRTGGVVEHDIAMAIPDAKQRLTVALVQKKVSEVLQDARFNNSFQIGMLASFESFLETAKVATPTLAAEEDGTFDDPDQSQDDAERRGIDVGSINNLARHYRTRFHDELPHPKMDAVVRRLSRAFLTGEKGLVFVRRVASVNELQRKLEVLYNQYLYARLRSELKPELRGKLDQIIDRFETERIRDLERRRRSSVPEHQLEDDQSPDYAVADDTGGVETFFAWFFRGDGPSGILSGATVQKRFSQAGSVNSTFFEDNHLSWLLEVRPGEVTEALANYLGLSRRDLSNALRNRVSHRLPSVKKHQRRNVYLAFQGAAIELLAEHNGRLRERAEILREERCGEGTLNPRVRNVPELHDWLEVKTFFTELRTRTDLRNDLWPIRYAEDFREQLREQELRRELISAMTRLGHPFIDLYVFSVNRLGRLELRAREIEDDQETNLIEQMLDLLERQRSQPNVFHSYRELHEAAQNFDLILAVNDPKVQSESLSVAATRFGGLLRSQQPVGGMFGQINETLVRQFRMPGYPLILITTDLLQEGEDLHTFCSSVYHYGISWMPSSMEQRIGRIDRVASQTDRKLSARGSMPAGDDFLQVYYPHLRETVEVLQVNRVLERLNRFMRLMHEDLTATGDESRKLNVSLELLQGERRVAQIQDPLRTAFPIREEFLDAPDRALEINPAAIQKLVDSFKSLPRILEPWVPIDWEQVTDHNALFGSFRLRTRLQPFTLLLRSIAGKPIVRCVSPVGLLQSTFDESTIHEALEGSGIRIAAVFDQKLNSYDITIEGDVLLGDRHEECGARVSWLLQSVAKAADRMEEKLLEIDQPMQSFREDLVTETTYGR
jgi:hypothetical protein